MDQVLDKNIEQSWYSLSLPAQMVNIGNEVKRAFRFTDTNKQNSFLDKAITYIKLTSKDKKNKKVVDEILIGGCMFEWEASVALWLMLCY